MSVEGKFIIQSSASRDEAMDLTGRQTVEIFHGFIEVQPTEEYHWEVVQGDEFDRTLAIYKSYHTFSNADQVFKRLPMHSHEAWRRLDIVLVDLSINSTFEHERTRRVTIADVDWKEDVVRIYKENDTVRSYERPFKSWK